ncbi:MAG: phosphoribosylglycinamide formyltransferase [Candidatus Marinimicrobia bacterium]|nr:phosphoribosylglycinamide formyltransferase [Candidatus Neomarinimicrobiota bacterium]MCF7827679.1 phosphoribosylglycinamide formyltransferase [Candidatus Neomarinimicrobiota bacterium]MCF7881266.1 phosphoribosylglycinamide formyltransferase [Candidatus Neomarinimicrobiota bacterium]
MARPQFAVFASGRGSNFLAVYQEIESGNIDGEISCVISNNASAPVLDKAEEFGLTAYHETESIFDSSDAYIQRISELLNSHSIDYILLAGYMKKIPAELVRQYQYKMVNIHPALLPSFGGKGYYGMNVHEAVINRGVKYTGVTLHFVDEIYDHGPIIYQYPVRVRDDDTAESLASRVLEYEHKAYPKVVRWLSKGWIETKDNKTVYTGPEKEWEI